MRLLLTTDTIGGVWDYTATLSRELERRGHSVLLAVLGRPSAEQLDELPEDIALECRDFRLEWMPGAEEDLAAAGEWLTRLARSWKAHVVHLNQLAYTGVTRFRAPTVVVVHSDVCSWFQEVSGEPPPRAWTRYVGWVRDGMSAASAVVTPTWYQASLTARTFGRSADRVIHNAVDASHVVEGVPKEDLLVCAGRAWDAAKGVATLDRAIALLGSDAPATALFGSVSGPAGERFEPLSLEYRGRVSPEELKRWMARASIYAGPSLYEPFGLAPVEAALHGCTLVLSDIGSFRELWEGCALFFPKGSAAGLARVIEQAIEDTDAAREMAAEARTRARACFGVDRFTAEYEALYEELAGGPTTKPRRPMRLRAESLN